jgi:hypothetical protein
MAGAACPVRRRISSDVGCGVEVATQDGQVAAAAQFGDCVDRLLHLMLANEAGTQRVVEHHGEQVNFAARPADSREAEESSDIAVRRVQSVILYLLNRPTTGDADPGSPAVCVGLLSDVLVVVVPECRRYVLRLRSARRGPRLG